MRNADLALYAAKADGHGALRLFDQTMYDREVRRVELDERLRRALSSQDLSVYYQPVLDLETGAITSAEALVRWFDGEQAVLAPDELISLAESTGSVTALGEWVMGQAIRQAAEWQRAGHSLSIAVNISTKQLLVGDLVATVDRLLRAGEPRPAAADSGSDRERAARGRRPSDLDDGPAARSGSPDRHRRLRDRLLIADLPQPAARRSAQGRSLLRLRPRSRRVEDRDRADDRPTVPRPRPAVTAEGVEHPHQLELLREMGVHHLQGFLISKPLSATDIVAFLDRGAPVISAGDPMSTDDMGQLIDWPEPRLAPAYPVKHVGRVHGSHSGELADRIPDYEPRDRPIPDRDEPYRRCTRRLTGRPR